MKQIPLLPVGQFRQVTPSMDGFQDAWSVSFDVGDLVYTLRFESADVKEIGVQDFFCEQSVAFSRNNIGYFVKFDNDLNEIDPQDSFKPLPNDRRRSVNEAKILLGCLIGGIAAFCDAYDPDLIIGLPNTKKLAGHYNRLCHRAMLDGRLIRMCMTYYHTLDVLVICRV